MDKKIAVVLFNLGGPSSRDAIKPFLFNLFYDRAIIRISNPFRFLLAKFISYKREVNAIKAYMKIGGSSPLLSHTIKQAEALEDLLNATKRSDYCCPYADMIFEENINTGVSMMSKDIVENVMEFSKQGQYHNTYKVFIGMRYWHPFIESIVHDVLNFSPEKIILLPLYPQFSTTTTGSSFNAWKKIIRGTKLENVESHYICCYYNNEKFIEAHTELILQEYNKAIKYGRPRILFSGHSLPQSIIDSGDSYQFQVEETTKLIVKKLKEHFGSIDYRVCYQSKVGPMKWLSPSTKSEIIAAASEKCPVVIVPIAFVSEHIETLVELDIEYKKLASKLGIEPYFRVSALQTNKKFIDCLARLCTNNYNCDGEVLEQDNVKFCSGDDYQSEANASYYKKKRCGDFIKCFKRNSC
ncbi:MAG: ferrochelatase [Candidatus Lariskella arthropodorum]